MPKLPCTNAKPQVGRPSLRILKTAVVSEARGDTGRVECLSGCQSPRTVPDAPGCRRIIPAGSDGLGAGPATTDYTRNE